MLMFLFLICPSHVDRQHRIVLKESTGVGHLAWAGRLTGLRGSLGSRRWDPLTTSPPLLPPITSHVLMPEP